MKHTPGPWAARKINFDYMGWATIEIADGKQDRLIATIHPRPTILDEMKANAHLITAAPQLLEACEAARKRIEEMMYPHYDAIMAQLDEAIAAAKGEGE